MRQHDRWRAQHGREGRLPNSSVIEVPPWDDPAVAGPAAWVEAPDRSAGGRWATVLARITWYLTWLLVAVLVIRFVLKLLGADPTSRFASAIYEVTFPFVIPFLGIIPTPQLGPIVVEGFTVIAMVCYVLLGTALAKFFELFVPERVA